MHYLFYSHYRLWVESFNDAHEKKKKRLSFTAYKPADAKFSWPTFEWEKYREGRIFLSVPSSAFELDRPEKSCAYVFYLHIQNTGFLSRADDTLCLV